jgi:prepilin-type N-terminal cleavage/methylation domain-containing protein
MMQNAGQLEHEGGFTLLELLVVMVVLSTLLAIIVPSFFDQTDKADDAGAQSDARVAVVAVETWAVDNDGSYSGVDTDAIRAIEPTLNSANIILIDVSASEYTVRSISTGARQFDIAREPDGDLVRSCAPPGAGACRDDGTWG